MEKILFISTSYFPINGGQEIGLETLLKELSSLGKSVCVLTPNLGGDLSVETISGIKVYRYRSKSIKYIWHFLPKSVNNLMHVLSAFSAVPKYLNKISPDKVVVYFLYPSGPAALFFLQLRKISHISYFGGSDISEKHLLLDSLSGHLLRKEQEILVTSLFLKQVMVTRFKINPDRIKVLPYGFHYDKFKSIPKVRKGEYRLLAVQRLVTSKKTDLLLQALDEIIYKGKTNFHLDIIGDGPELQTLKGITHRLNLESYVSFLGELSQAEVQTYYKKADIFLFPSESEGFGIVLIEALASACLVIAANSTAIPETIKDHTNGLLFKKNDVSDLSQVLDYALTNYNQCINLIKNGVSFAKKFDVKAIGDELIQTLQNI